ncbi:MAG: matrixin family metalloprotease [Kofleriaceae bacterium]
MVAWRWLVLGCVWASGCVEPERASFAWPIGTRPAAVLHDGSTDPRWTDMVDAARAQWSEPLVAMGCADPFGGNATTPVILVPDTAWTKPDAIGETTAEQIVVKGTMEEELANGSYTSVLPHELGHALGLQHMTAIRDPESIMHTPSDQVGPSALDIELAAETIGCR